MPEAVIVDAIRTPIGRAVKGSLRAVRPDDLAAIPLRALIERNPEVDFSTVVDVLMGCGYGQGESGYNVGRIALLLAGIDHHVPGCTVNRFCSSSLMTTRMAFHAIKTGEGDTYVAAASSPSAASGAARRQSSTTSSMARGRTVRRVHPDGHDRRERGRARKASAARRRTNGRVISQNRAVAAVESGHFDQRSCR